MILGFASRRSSSRHPLLDDYYEPANCVVSVVGVIDAVIGVSSYQYYHVMRHVDMDAESLGPYLDNDDLAVVLPMKHMDRPTHSPQGWSRRTTLLQFLRVDRV
ncbi:unnamed protein product [Euphydryas editha]|uniref:Uncharacterized protein n=1 Tax=Euphydryas editha TaxID=104508 RepID=A0AAU9UII2_EUPED|nr:unnamed protein product [Euphydryas editha]